MASIGQPSAAAPTWSGLPFGAAFPKRFELMVIGTQALEVRGVDLQLVVAARPDDVVDLFGGLCRWYQW